MKNAALFPVLLAVVVAGPLLAMESPPPQQPIAPVDEITVIGQRSLNALRLQIAEAEDLMYGLFNELNTEDLYDVHCVEEERFHSKIKERNCRTNYQLHAMRAEASYLVSLTTGVPTVRPMPLRNVEMEYLPKFRAHMKEVMEQNPELLEATVKYVELRAELQEQQAAYFDEEE